MQMNCCRKIDITKCEKQVALISDILGVKTKHDRDFVSSPFIKLGFFVLLLELLVAS